MDILSPTIEVMRSRTYPIVHERTASMISNMIKFQLEDMEEGSPLEEVELGERVTDRYIDALSARWTPVGVLSSQTVAENMTQSSLSSHRMAGVSKGASGFDRINEIAHLKNKSDIIRVVTTPVRGIPRSRDMINELANSIVEVSMDVLSGDDEIVDVRPPWYDTFMFLMNIPPQVISSRWIRLYMKKSVMYRYRLSMPAIYSVISDNIEKSTIAILYPPAGGTDRMYIDIHAGSLGDGDNSPLYMALATIRAQIVGGIPSVSSAAPVSINLLKDLQVVPQGDGVFELRSKAPELVPPNAWSYMIRTMVPDVEILSPTGRRFRSSNVRFHNHETVRHVILEIPNNYESIVDKMVVNDRGVHITFKKSMIDEYPFLEHVVMEDRFFDTEEEAKNFLLINIAEFTIYWYIECISPRAENLYALSEVDSTRTYTTSALNCKESLGYLAMRSMIYEAFRANIVVSPTIVGLIIDAITLYRQPVSFKRQAIVNAKSEFLTSSTFEDIARYLTRSGFSGEEDNMQSVSSRILSGQMIEIGQGGDRLNRENEYLKSRRESRKK